MAIEPLRTAVHRLVVYLQHKRKNALWWVICIVISKCENIYSTKKNDEFFFISVLVKIIYDFILISLLTLKETPLKSERI